MKFEIRFYEAIGKVCFYTVHVDGKEDCETDIFFKRFVADGDFTKDISEIRALLMNLGRFGAREERFRFEDNAHALPDTPNRLRLYCIRCTPETVILCGGGQKTSRRVQDSPDAYPHFNFAKYVEKLFRERISDDRSITYLGRFLEGELVFDTELL